MPLANYHWVRKWYGRVVDTYFVGLVTLFEVLLVMTRFVRSLLSSLEDTVSQLSLVGRRLLLKLFAWHYQVIRESIWYKWWELKMYDTDRSGKFYLWLNQIGVYVFVLIVALTNAGLCLPFSHSSHSVPPKAAEAGADQRLPTDGGGVHQEPGADEASGGKTGG